MKNLLILSLLFSAAFFTSCSQNKTEVDNLEGKRATLKLLRQQKRDIEAQMTTLEKEIKKLSPEIEMDPIIVSTTNIVTSDFSRYSDIQASVIGDDLVSASSETGGRIINLRLKEGDYVKRGQLIAVIDMEVLDRQIVEVETTLALAKTIYDRQSRLWEQNIGSEIQYLQAKNRKEQLEKSLETLKVQAAKRNVYAPISGYVDREILKQGEMASPGMPILQILNTGKLKVVADVPEHFLGKVKKGDLVAITFPALDKNISKRVSLMGRSIDPSNRTFKMEIDIPASGNIKPNLLAQVRIKDHEEKDVIIVEASLVRQEVTGKKYMYLAKATDNKMLAKKVYVQTGESDEKSIIITDGLSAKDIVIVDGANKVSENDVLEIIKAQSNNDGE